MGAKLPAKTRGMAWSGGRAKKARGAWLYRDTGMARKVVTQKGKMLRPASTPLLPWLPRHGPTPRFAGDSWPPRSPVHPHVAGGGPAADQAGGRHCKLVLAAEAVWEAGHAVAVVPAGQPPARESRPERQQIYRDSELPEQHYTHAGNARPGQRAQRGKSPCFHRQPRALWQGSNCWELHSSCRPAGCHQQSPAPIGSPASHVHCLAPAARHARCARRCGRTRAAGRRARRCRRLGWCWGDARLLCREQQVLQRRGQLLLGGPWSGGGRRCGCLPRWLLQPLHLRRCRNRGRGSRHRPRIARG